MLFLGIITFHLFYYLEVKVKNDVCALFYKFTHFMTSCKNSNCLYHKFMFFKYNCLKFLIWVNSLTLYFISSDHCSVTYPWLRVLFFFSCFNFSQERLSIIHCNFADTFSMLLLNDSQSLDTFEILVWNIFAFFASEFLDLVTKQALIEETSNENQIKKTYCRWKIIHVYEQEQVTLHFYRRRFWIF